MAVQPDQPEPGAEFEDRSACAGRGGVTLLAPSPPSLRAASINAEEGAATVVVCRPLHGLKAPAQSPGRAGPLRYSQRASAPGQQKCAPVVSPST